MKKAVCILLCLMMIIPSMVSLAEQKTIKSITLKVTQPKGGTTIMDNSWPEPPSGAHYTVVECYWMQKKGSTFQDMGETDVFVAGEEYQMDLRVVPDATYKFDPNVEVISNVTFIKRWMQGDDCLVTLQCTAVEAPLRAGKREEQQDGGKGRVPDACCAVHGFCSFRGCWLKNVAASSSSLRATR